jgi:hypothetical protein
MIVNGNANAKTGKKETQSRKGARTQRKPGSQNLEKLFITLPFYLHPDCNLDCNLCHPLSPIPLLLFFFASLRLCTFAFPSSSLLVCVCVQVGWTRKKSADSLLRRIG